MNNKLFAINLKAAHEQMGLSSYEVAKRLHEQHGVKISKTTVGKYAEGTVIQKQLPEVVLHLCEFYGVDWRDPSVVEVVAESPNRKSSLTAA